MKNIKKNKRGDITLGMVVAFILILIALFILIWWTVGLGKIMNDVGIQNRCSFSFLVSSWSKKGTGIDFVPPECAHKKITITSDDIDKESANIVKELNKQEKALLSYYNAPTGYEATKAYYKTFIEAVKVNANEKPVIAEYYIDKQISDELKRCWDMTGKGQLDLFSDWGGRLNCAECKDTLAKYVPGMTCEYKTEPHACSEDEILAIYKSEYVPAGAILGVVAGAKSPGGIIGKVATGSAATAGSTIALKIMFSDEMNIADKPPTFCVLCSRIKFDSQMVSSYGLSSTAKYESVPSWLANNHIPNDPTTYAEFLRNEQMSGFWAQGQYSYNLTSNYAVVYERVNTFGIGKMYDKSKDAIGGFFPDNDATKAKNDFQIVRLIPYNDIPKECTFLVG